MQKVSQFNFSQLNAQALIDAMPLCVALVNQDGHLAYASPAFYQLLRLPPDAQVVGSHVVDWLSPEEPQNLRDRLMARPVNPEMLSATVFRLARPDGTSLLCEIISRPLPGSAWIVSILRDVTNESNLKQRVLQNYDRQELLNHLLQLLYRPRNLREAFSQVLEMVGLFTHASRVSLMEITLDHATASVTMEWNENEAAQNDSDGAADRIVCIDFNETPALRDMVEAHGLVTVPSPNNDPPDLIALLARLRLQSLVALPVFGIDHLFGLMMIEFADQQCAWSVEDLDLMRNISRTISNAVARKQAEETDYAQRVLVETLRDITSVVNGDFSFSEVLEFILSNLSRIVPYSTSTIFLLDDLENLRVAYTKGFPPGSEERLRALSLQSALKEWKTLDRISAALEPVVIEDTLKDPDWVTAEGLNWVRSYMGAAIRSRGKLLGIITADSTTAGAFTKEHALRLQAFANQAAVAIANATLYQEAHRRAEEMTSLYQIGLTLASDLDLDQVLTSLHDQVSQVIPFDLFYVALYDQVSDLLSFPLFLEHGVRMAVPERNIQETPGLSGVVIQNRSKLYLHDIKDVEAMNMFPVSVSSLASARAFVGVPLIARGNVVGIISMQSYQPGVFRPEQVRLLETIANQAALSIDNARIFKEMKQLAITDSLTGLYNRRHFTALGQVEVERALRYQRYLGVLMVDIDFFKRVNDSFGHYAGDLVLQAVSRMCRAQLRSSDIIGRYGGEEFAIVLPETSDERARQVADRIRSMIETTEIDTPSGAVSVTISVGLALLTSDNVSLEELLDCADRAMYHAKQTGRNRVQVYMRGAESA